ncbi:hypothetical protein SALBM311S_12090 [Streptomyces alboniger]
MQSVPAGLAPPRTSPSGRLPFALHASILTASPDKPAPDVSVLATHNR